MSFIQSLLLALWAGYGSYDDQGPQMLRRPLLIGPVVGFVLGDVKQALEISATLELMWMGLGNMAGYQTPDMIVGTIVGIAFAITSGQGIAAGITLATTVAILSQQLFALFSVLRQFFPDWALRIAETGDFDKILQINFVSVLLQFLLRAVPTFLILFMGTGVVDTVLNAIPADILTGISKASGILPAVGLSILMTIILKKGMFAFMMLGFVLNAYLGLDILAITILSLAFATLYMWIMEAKQAPKVATTNGGVEEQEYDL